MHIKVRGVIGRNEKEFQAGGYHKDDDGQRGLHPKERDVKGGARGVFHSVFHSKLMAKA